MVGPVSIVEICQAVGTERETQNSHYQLVQAAAEGSRPLRQDNSFSSMRARAVHSNIEINVSIAQHQ